MIKRLGIFTLTIITGFFVFGGVVLGAGCAGGNVVLNQDQNTKNLIISGSGFSSIGFYKWYLEGTGSTLDPDLSTSTGVFNVYTAADKFNESVSLPSGSYLFVLVDPNLALGCSISFNHSSTVNTVGTVAEGGVCNDVKDCKGSEPMMCDKLDVNSSIRVCKQADGGTVINYLSEGASCVSNPQSISQLCDVRLGLSCLRVQVNPDIGMAGFEWQCAKASSSIIGGTYNNFTPFPDQFLNIPKLINLIIKFSIGVAGIVAFFLLAVGSYKYMLSAGDPKALQSAQETISSAIAGLVLIILAVSIFGIMSGILQIPGIDLAGDNLNIETPNIPDSK